MFRKRELEDLNAYEPNEEGVGKDYNMWDVYKRFEEYERFKEDL
jgi:hypothetical protein